MIVVSFSNDSKESGIVWEWVVPKERFSDPQNAWSPDTGKFPVDLNKYCVIASSNIMGQFRLSSPPELTLIHVRQVSALVNTNDVTAPPLRRMVVSFHFNETGIGRDVSALKPVVMLLDGTVATIRTNQAVSRVVK